MTRRAAVCLECRYLFIVLASCALSRHGVCLQWLVHRAFMVFVCNIFLSTNAFIVFAIASCLQCVSKEWVLLLLLAVSLRHIHFMICIAMSVDGIDILSVAM